MKLLFDQNLSFRLCGQLADIFPGSEHVRPIGLSEADDRTMWDYAKANGFALVSLDSDFADMAALRGPPPKVIWLRFGNRPALETAGILRQHAKSIISFAQDAQLACLEIY